MQTLRTWAQNLRSIDKAELTFDPQGMTAVVGPKGSGKSTLAALAPLIAGWGPPGGTSLTSLYRAQGTGDMVVGWEFRADQSTVVVERRFLRRTTKGVTSVVTKSVSLTVDGKRRAVSADQLTDQVTKLTGMTAHQYASTAYVAQGDIDSLVSATPANVEKALIKLTGLTDLSNAADRMKAALRPEDKKIAAMGGSADDADTTEARARTHEAEATAAETVARQAGEAASTAREAYQAAANTHAQMVHAARRDEAVAEKRRELERNEADQRALSAGLDAATVAEAPARREQVDAQIAVMTAALPVFDRDLAALDRAHTDLAALPDTSQEQMAEAEKVLADADKAAIDAATTEASLRAGMEALAGRHQCPTCNQGLGDGDPATFLKGMAASLETAQTAAAEARTARSAADAEVSRLRAAHARRSLLEPQVTEIRGRLAAAWESLPPEVRTPDPADQAAALGEALTGLRAQSAELSDLMQRIGAIRSAEATVARSRAELDALTADDATAPTPDQIAQAQAAEVEAYHVLTEADEAASVATVNWRSARAVADQDREAARHAAQAWAAKKAALDAVAVREAQVKVARALTRSLVHEFCATVSMVASAALADLPGEIVGLVIDERYTPEAVLADGTRRPTSAMSGGERALVGLMLRVGIAAHGTGALPDMLIADEPIAALDEESRVEVLTRLTEMKIPVVIISHTPEVTELADRVVRLDRPALGTTAVAQDR